MKCEEKLKKLIRKAKNQHEHEQLQGANSKKMWQFVNIKLDKQTKNKQINDTVVNGEVISDDSSKANHFNAFFSNVATELRDKIVSPAVLHEIPNIPKNQR